MLQSNGWLAGGLDWFGNRVVTAAVCVEHGFVVQLLFVPEVVVDAGDIYISGETDLAHRRSLKTLVGKDRSGGMHDPVASVFGGIR